MNYITLIHTVLYKTIVDICYKTDIAFLLYRYSGLHRTRFRYRQIADYTSREDMVKQAVLCLPVPDLVSVAVKDFPPKGNRFEFLDLGHIDIRFQTYVTILVPPLVYGLTVGHCV